MSPQEYFRAFLAGQIVFEDDKLIRGRILRGKKRRHFENLSDDEERRLIMLLGMDGLKRLPQMSGYQMLQFIGYTEEAIAHRVAEGFQFKLVVFTDVLQSRLATWHEVLMKVREIYPDIAEYLEEFREELARLSFSEIEARAGYKFWEVEKKGPADWRYVTYDRLVNQPRSLVLLRAFLYHCLHLRELYRGDGFADNNGERGPAEYVARNVKLSELGDYKLIDLTVELN